VEHPFRYIKQVFGYDKVRYRGLANRLHLLAPFCNLLIGENYSGRRTSQCGRIPSKWREAGKNEQMKG
tara:strand:+ start:17187 stop:17390 length:204 start_codon:yes stop_codon:yes gene_type:complete